MAGGDGKDTLNGKDGVQANDVLDGGAGSDACQADPGDQLISCP